MSLKTIIALALIAAPSGILLGLMLHYSAAGYAAFSLLTFLFLFFLARSMEFIDKEGAKRRTRDGMERALRILCSLAGKASTFNNIGRASLLSGDAEVGRILSKTARRLELGEGLAPSLYCSVPGEMREFRECAKDADAISVQSSLSKMLERYEYESRSRRYDLLSASQRHSTINMFISTIAPSFLAFAFVGDMVMSSNFSWLPMFTILMLFVVPMAYITGNMLLFRRLLA